MNSTTTRQISVTREGDHFRLAFKYDKDLVDRARGLPFAFYDETSSTWLTRVCAQSVQELWGLFYDGLCDTAPDSLLEPGEEPIVATEAILRGGTQRMPYVIHTMYRDGSITSKLKALPTARYSKDARGWMFAPQAAAGIAELVATGRVTDPEGLIETDKLLVSFDVRSGDFKILFDDPRAQKAFRTYYPQKDVVAAWEAKGFEIGFTDEFSKEVYQGGLANVGEGIQPEGFTHELYPYQRQAVAMGIQRSGLLICDEAGLGKTSMAIGVGVEAYREAQITRILAIVPAHLRTQWSEEITKFTEETDIVVIDGPPKKRKELYAAAKDAKWVIVHYDILHRDLAMLKPLARGALLVVDEAHRIRNVRTQRAKAVRSLGNLAGKRLGLTATAVENSPDEWYWVLSGFTVPGSLGTWGEFANRYMYPGRFGGYEGARNITELAARSKAHFVRRRKADVATFLPPLQLQHLALDPDPATAAALKRVHRDAKDELAAMGAMKAAASARHFGDGEDYEEALDTTAGMTAVGMLKMLCSSPKLVQRSDSESAEALLDAGLIPDVDGPKMDELRVIAAEYQAANDRIVIFTSFKRMVDLITERFDEDGIRYVTITGSASRKKRDQAVRDFTDPDTPITALVSTDAGAEGLNLGKTCSTLINVDIPWTAGRLEQRANRIHRLDGKHESYRVLNLTVRGTIEEGILRRVENKEDLTRAIYGDVADGKRITGRVRGSKPAFLLAINELPL